MSLALDAKRAGLLAEAKVTLTRLNGLYARMLALPVADIEALQMLSRAAALNAGDLSDSLSDLSDNAAEARIETVEQAYREQRLNGLRKAQDPYAYINLSSAGGAL